MRIKMHVEGIKGSSIVQEGEEPTCLFNGMLEIDGHLIDECFQVEAVFKGGGIMDVKAHLYPGSFEVVSHTDQSWPEMLVALQEQKKAWSGSGRVIASLEEE